MLKTLTNFHKGAAVLSIILLISAGVLAVMFWRKSVAVTALEHQVYTGTVQLEQNRSQIARHIVPPDLPAMNRFIPKDWEIPLLMADLTTNANTAKVTVVKISPAKESPSSQQTKTANKAQATVLPTELSGVQTKDLVISVAGEADSILKFLDGLQNMPRLIWVKSFELKPDTQVVSEASAKWQSTITVAIFAKSPWDV